MPPRDFASGNYTLPSQREFGPSVQRPYSTIFSLTIIFLLHVYFSKTIPRKNIYLCIAALYINTAASFKSNITKIIAGLLF